MENQGPMGKEEEEEKVVAVVVMVLTSMLCDGNYWGTLVSLPNVVNCIKYLIETTKGKIYLTWVLKHPVSGAVAITVWR